MWRGSLLPLGRAAAPQFISSSVRHTAFARMTTASQPSGSKLPRHKCDACQLNCCEVFYV
ncbi:hypothetical protein EJA72_07795 [Pseudomonas sp. PB120]|nr:hypothetical protein [Pseudomonas sp. PB120]